VDGVRHRIDSQSYPQFLCNERDCGVRGTPYADRINDPAGKVPEEFGVLGSPDPYAWPVVGWPFENDSSHLQSATADEFLTPPNYFDPQNIPRSSLVATSSGQSRGAGQEVSRRIPRPETPPDRRLTLERETARGEAAWRPRLRPNRRAAISSWHNRWAFRTADSYPAGTILRQILSTNAPRRPHKRDLRARQRRRQETYATSGSMEMERHVQPPVVSAEEGTHARGSRAGIYDNLERLKKEEGPPEELQRSRNNFCRR